MVTKLPIALQLVLFVCAWWVSSPGWAGGPGEAPEGQDQPRTIVVLEAGQAAGEVAYRVVNCSDLPLHMFVLGTGAEPAMQSIVHNEPREIGSPEGWHGQVVAIEETIFMQIVWEATKPAAYIGPGEALGGFRLVKSTAPPPKEPLFHVDGTPLEILDFSSAPYTVCFANDRCVHGQVGAGECGGETGDESDETHGE